ncbi:hypothetical protein L1987_38220 [Smallanthus sonchifolius]|uniref:Uncharacterized protein n=1 Tax=Smallanthus sonchifolius TaxID=185202 RepID=A0ACB9HJY7_9ASTR|nr:hypothetical protein L1987_38220 [Smallanthus sonchifolius]
MVGNLSMLVIARVLAKGAWSRMFWEEIAYNTGFIQEDGNRSLEDIAEGYLMDLIDRNLVIIAYKRKYNGSVVACKVHDLVRELCLKKAMEERFILQTDRLILSSQFSNVLKPPYKPLRLLLCNKFLIDDIAKYIRSFVLLRVLDLETCVFIDFPKGMELLVHLRYLAILTSSRDFPSSICNLWNLQTLIYRPSNNGDITIVLPSNISDLVNLRHLYYIARGAWPFILPSIEKPMNLQTISIVELRDGLDKFQKCFPYIKKLECVTCEDEEYDFKSLTYLEKLYVFDVPKGCVKNHITFPSILKTLTLRDCGLPWSDMLIIQSLPNLQVLKLVDDAFKGSYWNTYEQDFQQLKFLRLQGLNIEQWEAYSTSFPCLSQLEVYYCEVLEETPLEIGDIPSLELIQIKGYRHSVGESVRRIQEEQNDLGNYHLRIDISHELP